MSSKSIKLRALPEDQWLRDFRRALRYVRPQRKYLLWSILFIVLGAATYSASLGLILPVLKVMVEPEGLHGWVYRLVAESRTGLRFDAYDSQRYRPIPGAAEFSLLVRDVQPGSPLGDTSLRANDIILRVNDSAGPAPELLQKLARAPAHSELRFELLADAVTERPAVVTLTSGLPEAPWKLRLLRAAVGLVPAEAVHSDRLRTLLIILGCLFAVQLMGNTLRFGADYLTALVSHRAILDLRRHMSRQVMALPVGHYSRNVTDTISRFIQDTQELHKGYVTVFQKLIREPLKAVAVLVLAFLLDWRLTFVLLVVAPLAAYLIRRFGKKVRKANLRVLQGYSMMLAALEGALSGIRVVKSYAMEQYERKRLFRIDRRMLREQLRMERTDALSKPVMELIGFMAVAVCVMWLGYHVVGGTLKPADFATIVILLAAMFDPLRKLSNTYVRLQRANAAAHRIFLLIDTPAEQHAQPGAPPLRPLGDAIEFHDVTFTYQGTHEPALCSVNLTVKKGEVMALVGPNGSGKTTLVSLLLRFFDPQDGRILFDGVDTREVSLRSLRNQISLISQETVIFGDTVRANIAYGKQNASDQEIIEAAKRAFAHDFITQLPNGYDSMIGERGATLSGGQCQRLAIARVILRNAPILVFDEATSQIDSESELKIQQALEAFVEGRTAFVIAHRFSTIHAADRIAVFDAGRIVAVGTHNVLMESCDLYRRLYETGRRTAHRPTGPEAAIAK
jgi:ABC-type multidrug transport system fused ATPase/permease subunit